jgi:hypothetical protein
METAGMAKRRKRGLRSCDEMEENGEKREQYEKEKLRYKDRKLEGRPESDRETSRG